MAIVGSVIAAGVARPVADALAQRRPVRLPPVSRWVSLALDTPRPATAATGLVAALVLLRWGVEPVAAAVALVAAGAATVASLVDLRCHRLPDLIVGPLGAGLVLAAGAWSVAAGDGRWLVSALLAGATAGAVLGVGWLVGMGLGDVKFGAVLGVLLGWAVGSPTSAVLVALGGVGLASLGATGWWGWGAFVRGDAPRWFPFGPFLAGSTLVIGLLTGPPTGLTPPVGDAAHGPPLLLPGLTVGEPVRPS